MRILSDEQMAIWRSPDKTGPRRPVGRATIQAPRMTGFQYNSAAIPGGSDLDKLNYRGRYNSVIFGNTNPLRELPNILEIDWTRSTEQDVATGKITLLNTKIVPIGSAGHPDEYDQPGALSPTYGKGGNPWGYAEAGWKDAIVEDAIIRTYEGYGCDPTVWPAQDDHLEPSGTWLVDDVDYNVDGNVEITVRDVGRIFLDSIADVIVIPTHDLPLAWSTRAPVKIPIRVPHGGAYRVPRGRVSSSNSLFVGKGLVEEDGGPYVDANGGWRGHIPSHALNGTANRYWMSVGYPRYDYKAYWEIDLTSRQGVAALRVFAQGGPYRVFVSLQDDNGRWYGKRKIPVSHSTFHGVDQKPLSIPFIYSEMVPREISHDIVLPKVWKRVKKIRLTFHDLMDYPMPGASLVGSQWGHEFRRAGLRKIQVYSGDGSKMHVSKSTATITEGNVSDYTDIPKKIAAWGGLFWPDPASGQDFTQVAPGVREHTHQIAADPVLSVGRAWGDFQQAGTAMLVGGDLTADLFTRQPLWESITQVRDVLNFVCFIDEVGGMIWRPPNIWKVGNYLTPNDLSARGIGRQDGAGHVLVLKDTDLIVDYSVTRSGRSIREYILVANPSGKPGAFRRGFSTAGLQRLSAYTDVNLASEKEVQTMADFIATRQMFTARKGNVVIPATPAIQIDDQVALEERVTGEQFLHRVETISSALNVRDGKWEYTMSTHWVGDHMDGSLVYTAGEAGPEVTELLGNWGLL